MTDTASHSAMSAPQTASSLLEDALAGRSVEARSRLVPFPTGFTPLDDVLIGGFRAQDLVLVGGRPGVGKTVSTLQWARWNAMHGRTSVYICYEHGPHTLLGRLLALELGSLVRADEMPTLDQLRQLAQEVALGSGSLAELTADPLGEEAYGRLRSYGDNLRLMQASGKNTDIPALESIIRDNIDGPTIVFVDYLQKIPVRPNPHDEDERTTMLAEALKDLAMSYDVPIIAAAAGDKPGLNSRRLRLPHLRGSTALAHECDVAILLNEKSIAVSKAHLAYNPVRAETFRRQVVFSVEKNREGPTEMDIEFRKDFANYRFDPEGGFVQEALVDEILYEE